MEAMTILKRCRNAAGDIERLKMRIQRRRDALLSISAPQADPNGGSRSTSDTDKIGRALADIDALERELGARKQRQAAEIAAACVLIDGLSELPGAVLHGYYIRRETTAVIASRLGYTDSYIRRVKRSAEEAIGQMPPERVASALPPWYLPDEKGGSP